MAAPKPRRLRVKQPVHSQRVTLALDHWSVLVALGITQTSHEGDVGAAAVIRSIVGDWLAANGYIPLNEYHLDLPRKSAA